MVHTEAGVKLISEMPKVMKALKSAKSGDGTRGSVPLSVPPPA